VRAEKIKVWRAIQPIHPADTVRGQYGPGMVDGKPVGYRQEDRVHPRSQTETYAALRLEIENWRWAGVPFYIRAGKRLAKRVTEITIQFKQPPLLLFKDAEGKGAEGIRQHHLHAHPAGRGHCAALRAKVPGPT
jgi:glucose-6-phosphate 1-dehydrogenase